MDNFGTGYGGGQEREKEVTDRVRSRPAPDALAIPLLKPLLITGAGACSECTDRKCLESGGFYLCDKLQKRFREVWGIQQERSR